MKAPLIALALFAASATLASAQETRQLSPIDVASPVQFVTVKQLADETGLSPNHVRMVLGSRSDHADYRIIYDRKEQQFRKALGEDRYQDLLAGRPIELRNQPSQGLVAATEAPRKARKDRP